CASRGNNGCDAAACPTALRPVAHWSSSCRRLQTNVRTIG
ncbi:MAG: hypothetical protein AVDCRST_MAG71-765, partial [uncultured Lysobacter sp.]